MKQLQIKFEEEENGGVNVTIHHQDENGQPHDVGRATDTESRVMLQVSRTVRKWLQSYEIYVGLNFKGDE